MASASCGRVRAALLSAAVVAASVAAAGCNRSPDQSAGPEPAAQRAASPSQPTPPPLAQPQEPAGMTDAQSNSPVAAAGDTVSVHYVGTLEDGSKFDSSRDSGRPLTFTVGDGGMIAGFDKGVRGMRVGEKRRLELEPKDAYGERNEQAIITLPKARLGDLAAKVKVGDQLAMQTPRGAMPVKVLKIDADTVTLDANHELAGKKLFFDIELVDLKKAG